MVFIVVIFKPSSFQPYIQFISHTPNIVKPFLIKNFLPDFFSLPLPHMIKRGDIIQFTVTPITGSKTFFAEILSCDIDKVKLRWMNRPTWDISTTSHETIEHYISNGDIIILKDKPFVHLVNNFTMDFI